MNILYILCCFLPYSKTKRLQGLSGTKTIIYNSIKSLKFVINKYNSTRRYLKKILEKKLEQTYLNAQLNQNSACPVYTAKHDKFARSKYAKCKT